MKTHDFHTLTNANRLALRYTLLALVCLLVTILEIKLLNVGAFWQSIGIIGASAFMLAAHRAYSAPRRNEVRRIREALHASSDSFVDPL